MSSEVFTNAIAILLSLRPQANDSVLLSAIRRTPTTEAQRYGENLKSAKPCAFSFLLNSSVTPCLRGGFWFYERPLPTPTLLETSTSVARRVHNDRRLAIGGMWTCDSR